MRAFAAFIAFVSATFLVVGCVYQASDCRSDSDCPSGSYCSRDHHVCFEVRTDGGSAEDGGSAGDAGGAVDSGTDAGVEPDGGGDAGVDAGPADAGQDGGIDAGYDAGNPTWRFVDAGPIGILNDVWGTSSSDVWAVGAQILHWDGASWKYEDAGTWGGLTSISGCSDGSLIAVGAGDQIISREGGAWSPDDPGVTDVSFTSVWCGAAREAFAVGWRQLPAPGTVLLHRQGGVWQVEDAGSAALYRVWGDPTGTIWAVGENGTVLRRSSGVWSATPTGASGTMAAIAGGAWPEFWVVGNNSALQFQDGGWLSETTGVQNPRGAWAAPGGRIWAASFEGRSVFRRDSAGNWVSEFYSDAGFSGIWGSGPADMWAVGSWPFTQVGTIFHRTE